MSKHPVVLAISGASGAIYGKKLFDLLKASGSEIHLIITSTAKQIIKDEIGIDEDYFVDKLVTLHDNNRYDVSIASGSFLTSGMVIAPCSMGALGRIASGVSTDLVSRVADVHLKERRKLVIVARETPLSSIHLENMLRLSNAGATLMPAMPAFYNKPATIDEMTSSFAGRVLDQLGIDNDTCIRYQGGK